MAIATTSRAEDRGFFEASVEPMADCALPSGHTRPNRFCTDDPTTLDCDRADLAAVAYGGV